MVHDVRNYARQLQHGAIATLLSLSLPSVAWGQELSISVINFTDLELQSLYISSSEREDWGDDLLESLGPIPANGGEIPLPLVADPPGTCVYDILGVFENNSPTEAAPEELFWAIDLCDLSDQGGSFAFFQDYLYTEADYESSVRLINNGDQTLLALATAPDGTDLLGNASLEPGYHLDLPLTETIASQCIYDLKAIFLRNDVVLGDTITDNDITEVPLTEVDLCSEYVAIGGSATVQKITLVNGADPDYFLEEVYIYPTNANDIGPNQLAYGLYLDESYETLLVGECGQYDILGIFHPLVESYLESSDETPLNLTTHTASGVELCNGSTYTFDQLANDVDNYQFRRGGSSR